MPQADKVAAERAGSKLIAKLEDILRSALHIRIDCYGLDRMLQVEKLRDGLGSAKDVSSVALRLYYPGFARLDVRFQGTTDGLSRAIDDWEIDGEALGILEVRPGYIRVDRCEGRARGTSLPPPACARG